MVGVKSYSKGFTLIELMIVIAIIGILASIALPVYVDYTAKAQATEALRMNTGTMADIGDYYAQYNNWPNTNTVLGADIIGTAKTVSGKYAKNANQPIDITTGALTVEFTTGANQGGNLVITPQPTPTGQIQSWRCSSTTLSQSRLPSGCR